VKNGRIVAFDLDPMRIDERQAAGANAELTEGYLVCRSCRVAYPVLAGTAILPVDVKAHLATHGNVYRRLAIPDPRLARFLLGNADDGGDFVPFDEVVSRYADLLPFDPATPPRPMSSRDARLDDAIRSGGGVGPALEIGCGVGRGTFLLAARTGDAIGVDRSIARVRRARNVQTTDEFLLPLDATRRSETAIDLTRLARRDVDFLVADPEVLPFPDRAFATVVVRDGDGSGPFTDSASVRHEALRVAAPGALVLVEGKGAREGEAAPFEKILARGDARAVDDRTGGGARVR
jgi:SAM-dependent methyltransferase